MCARRIAVLLSFYQEHTKALSLSFRLNLKRTYLPHYGLPCVKGAVARSVTEGLLPCLIYYGGSAAYNPPSKPPFTQGGLGGGVRLFCLNKVTQTKNRRGVFAAAVSFMR